jgi:3-dehydroquinate synthase
VQPERLRSLLAGRFRHYASFPLQLDTSCFSLEEAAWKAQVCLGAFRLQTMRPAYDVRVRAGSLDACGAFLSQAGLTGPAAVVGDEHTSPLYAPAVLRSLAQHGIPAHSIVLPAGETHKTLASVEKLWQAFLSAGLERGGLVAALGGGVVGDLAGFAAATYLRGVAWAALPTSLLAMVDASLGGKTGANLPQGKNLIGAFHAPRLVLADPDALQTLPEAELRSGMAEVVKAGIIGDPGLFERCRLGWEALQADWEAVVRGAMAVKVAVIEADPYEQGERACLNLGHTIGHALERLSAYRLRHGEAVAIGMVVEARLSERLGLARPGLADEIAAVLDGLGLPVEIPPGVDRQALVQATQVDKKRSAGRVRFALPVRIGEVQAGVELEDLPTWIDHF